MTRTLVTLLPLVLLAACASPEEEPASQSQDVIDVTHTIDELAPFTTDGCSMFPDGSPGDRTRWQHCCIEHDFEYFMGGTRKQRAEADRRLAECVDEAASPLLGNLMWAGVRLGGTPALPTPWRWGYGWKYDPFDGFRDLSSEEVAAAEEAIAVYLDEPEEPVPYEERYEALSETVAAVPGLDDAVTAVQEEAARVD